MKKEIAFVFAIMLLSFTVVSAAETGSMIVKTNVLPEEVSISVPDTVTFQDIAPGYLSERQDIDVVNTGTVDVSISTDLDTLYTGDIFTNIGFKKTLAEDLINLRYFDLEVMKPSVVGGERSEGIYMYLDLSEYSGETAEADHTTSVIFTAVPL